jgi:hypothetical protein
MRLLSISLAMIAATAACGGGDDDGPGGDGTDDGDDDGAAAVTYYKDVKPLVDAKCTGCHSPEGIAPFSLLTLDDVDRRAELMLEAIEADVMPPWPPNADCNDYHADRSLSAEQKALFRAWVDGGRAPGDAASPGPPLDVERVQLSRVDAELTMSAAYTPQTNAQKSDDYRCFVIPWEEAETRFITGFRAVPGNAKVVHHVIAFLARPDDVAAFQQLDAREPGDGYTCFGGAGGVSEDVWLGSWAPGTLGSDMPAGTGLRVDPGSAIILQVHYNVLSAAAEPDRTRIQFKLDETVEDPSLIQPWANRDWLSGNSPMLIPAGAADTRHAFVADATYAPAIGGNFTLHTAGLHMHQLGTRATATVIRANGTRECVLQIDDWNFHWQGSYALREPIEFRRGDQLSVECHFDNSPENQPIVNGTRRVPRDVTWGEGTSDEMCLGIFYATPN